MSDHEQEVMAVLLLDTANKVISIHEVTKGLLNQTLAHPREIFREAVRRMLPKNKLGRRMLSKLKIYAGPDHPHQAQQPKPLPE